MKPLVCITGAAGGLGKAFAVECASRGWDLFLTDLSETALSTLADGLTAAYGIEAVHRACDLTDHASRAELFEYLRDRDFKFKILINIAGLDYEGLFAERTPEQIRTILRLNIEANLEMTYSILKLRDRGQPFRVINVSSLAAFYPMPVKAMYAASKRFLLDFSMALREELRPVGGTVTALCPAGMPTTISCIRAIDAQGFAGRVTTKNVGFVAAHTIDHALKGHAVYIPGMLNRALRFLGGLFPPAVVARLIGNRWNAAHNKKDTPAAENVQYGY
jgi:hypothetical protein